MFEVRAPMGLPEVQKFYGELAHFFDECVELNIEFPVSGQGPVSKFYLISEKITQRVRTACFTSMVKNQFLIQGIL